MSVKAPVESGYFPFGLAEEERELLVALDARTDENKIEKAIELYKGDCSDIFREAVSFRMQREERLVEAIVHSWSDSEGRQMAGKLRS